MPLLATPLQVVVNDMADNTNPLCLSTLDYVEGEFKVRGPESILQQPNFGDIGLLYVSSLLLAGSYPL